MTVEMAPQVDAIKAWCLAGTGLGLVLLVNEASPETDGAWIEIAILQSTREGTDHVTYTDMTTKLVPVVTCSRVLSVRIAVECLSQDPDAFALGHLEQLRAFAKVRRMTEILGTADLVLVDAQDPVNVDAISELDDRFVSRFEMLATFRWSFQVTGDFTDDATSWIEKVNALGTLTGSDLPVPIEVDIHPED